MTAVRARSLAPFVNGLWFRLPARVRRRFSPKVSCEHGRTWFYLKVSVYGVDEELRGSPQCPPCTEAYLNAHSAVCASCWQAIFPGSPVAAAWDGAPQPFTHLNDDCCLSAGLYCGTWTEDGLKPFD